MSALHASDQGPSHYLRTKAAAERVVHDGCGEVGWTIFQPSVVFGTHDSFVNRFAGLLQWLPFLPLARANARFAPVHVEDVVSAFVLAMHDPKTISETYQLCGPEVFTLREIVCLVRDQLGLRRWVFGIPDWLARLQAAIMDFVPGKPLSTDNYLSLTVDSVCTHDGLARLDLERSSLRSVMPAYLGAEQRAGRLARLRARR
jgi:NADH dehydrogenase